MSRDGHRPIRVVVTGSRDWTDWRTILRVLGKLRARAEQEGRTVRLAHGGARGADSIADAVGKVMGFDVDPYPADWVRRGRQAGPVRNSEMLVAEDPDEVLAFPLKPKSVGTLDCARLRALRNV